MRRCGLLWALITVALAAPAEALTDPQTAIRHVLEAIESERYELARAYLDPLVIDPRLTWTQRARAYYYRGYTFEQQDMVVSAVKDYRRALDYDSGNPAALTALGHLYLAGRGLAADPAAAFSLFQRAARAGYVPAKALTGHALLTGTGVAQDLNKARFWLDAAADEGHLQAMVFLALSYRSGYAPEPDLEAARDLYEKAASRGNVDALVALGHMHQDGELGAPNPVAAAAYFERAAEAGSAAGQASLGHLYLTGKGESKDLDAARNWFRQAAAQGHPAGSTGLGYLAELAGDLDAARRWYGEAAAADYVPAQMRLAQLLLSGGSEEEVSQAMQWFRAAAAKGAPEAENGLAWLLATTPHEALRDPAEAIRHAERAVDALRNAATLDTLAAAHAAAGDFESARRVQAQAIEVLAEETSAAVRAGFEKRMNAYRAGRAWQE